MANDETSSAAILARSRAWVQTWVVGLNLCPFARGPFESGRIRWQLSAADHVDALLDDLRAELTLLAAADPAGHETTLLIHPWVLGEFDEFNQFLDPVERTVAAMGLEGVIQVASFHPHYRFADAPANDPANASNRSPYPMLHLLREASISAIIDGGVDTDAIVQRNLQTLRSMTPAQMADQQARLDSLARRSD